MCFFSFSHGVVTHVIRQHHSHHALIHSRYLSVAVRVYIERKYLVLSFKIYHTLILIFFILIFLCLFVCLFVCMCNDVAAVVSYLQRIPSFYASCTL